MIKKVSLCLLISLLIATSLVLIERHPFYQLLELKLYDLQMNLRTPPKQDERILFVEMDEEAIENLGRWPWPRNIFANIINTLNSLNAKQVIFDVTFTQPTQVIVDKSAIEHVFKGNRQISDYITQEAGAIKSKETLAPDDVAFTLDQIHNGFNQYVSASQKKLQNALVDNDKILAQSFKKNNVFIGYSFEVVTDKTDSKNFDASIKMKKDLLEWIKAKPKAPFEKIPATIKNASYTNEGKLRAIFLRSKITHLLISNIALSLEQASMELNADAERIRPDFNLAKKTFIKEKILAFLDEKPEAEFIESIYHYEIFDPSTQDLFKEMWPNAKKEFAAVNKFSLPKLSTQNFFKSLRMDSPYHKFTEIVGNGGFLNGIPNNDGILRYVPTFISHNDKMYPHIAIASILNLYTPQYISFESDKYFTLHRAKVNGTVKDVRIPLSKNG